MESLSILKRDRVSGGYALGVKALDILKAVHKLYLNGTPLNKILDLLRMLRDIRPEMGIVYNIGDIPLKVIESNGDIDSLDIIIERFTEILNSSKERINHALNYIKLPEKFGVVTLSYSSNVIEFIDKFKDRISTVYLLESRPGKELPYALEKMAILNISIKLLPDSNIYHAVKNAKMIVIGMDNLTLNDGLIIHKAGTYPLLLAGEHNELIKIMIGERLKITDSRLKKIKMDKWRYRVQTTQQIIDAYPFDITPLELIDYYVYDGGFLYKPSPLDITNLYINLYLSIIA